MSYVNADCREFRFYSSGIIDNDITCSNGGNMNHYLVGVGYNVQGSNDYATLENTWGTDWGENGMV